MPDRDRYRYIDTDTDTDKQIERQREHQVTHFTVKKRNLSQNHPMLSHTVACPYLFCSTNNTHLQENGSDCGAFAVSFASYVSDDLPFDFRQADITQMRRRMVWSLLKQQLV